MSSQPTDLPEIVTYLGESIESLLMRQGSFEEGVRRAFEAHWEALADVRYALGSDIRDDTSVLIDGLWARIEHYLATTNTELTPTSVAYMLRAERIRAYEFFCVHTEQWKADAEFIKAEQGLHDLLMTPIRIADFNSNRAELGSWRGLSWAVGDLTPINRDEILERATEVLEVADGEIQVEPTVKRLWTALAASSRVRKELRTKHGAPWLESSGESSRGDGSKPKGVKKVAAKGERKSSSASVSPATKDRNVA